MNPRPPSIQRRLLAFVIAASAILWGGAAVLTYVDSRHELDELLDAHLAQAASLLVVQQAGEPEEAHAPDAPVLHRYAPRVAFQVFHDGRIVLRSSNAPAGPMMDPVPAAGDHFSTVEVAGVPWRVFQATAAGDVLVLVGEQQSARAAILRAVLRGSLAPLLLALPLLVLALWWGVRSGLAPLAALGRSLAARAPEDATPFADAGAPTEIRPVLDALNGLLSRIAGLRAAERRFIADAAHELRTPIAAIRAQAQVALAEPDAQARGHALQATLEGCDRAARLAGQLLQLSRLESGAGLSTQPLDLSALARRTLAEATPAALAQGQALDLDAPQAAPLQGDETLLGLMLRNLVDNAIRHAGAGARIAVQARAGTQGALLVVEDSGPGVAEGDLERLGERFFRPAGTAATGSGLGLSIVQRVAQAHGGRLVLSRSSLGGLCARVELPAKPTPHPERPTAA